ncbi:MAG: homoserine dehydrogenase [Candidatus Dormibacteraeota bacterium]|nr:homoserine dehydrogenase [Candidatus Dormibacteraeota bacterium]MBV9525767.1 homoserine dehydrogenase [Candidatus Dormibacteraeota bacterium]
MQASLGIGMLGLGTVGSAVAARLIGEWEMLGARAGVTPVLRRVAVRDLTRTRDVDLRNVELTSDAQALVDDPAVDIVVEVMGGVEPARSLISRALQRGKTVVTANKAVIAESGPALAGLAASHGAGLWFEAAVGGGLPIVALLRASLGADVVRGVDSIVNATTNIMLTRMREEGVRFETAVAEAQRRGFAEADPSSDVDGWDAAYKLVIMSWLAFGVHVEPEAVDRRGIRDVRLHDLAYTGQLGYSVKLVAHAERAVRSGAVHLRVRPTAVPADHPLYAVDDSDNAVIISSDLADTVILSGLGGGGASTASAVVSDVVQAARTRGCPPAAPLTAEPVLLSDEDVEVAGYLRLIVDPSGEAQAAAVQMLEDRGVPVTAAFDKPPLDGPFPQLLLLTGAAPRAVHDRALETLDTLPVVREIACAMDRIESAA